LILYLSNLSHQLPPIRLLFGRNRVQCCLSP